ncbi:hypothetical protein EDB85DRAFT_416268 [Lactarius pseudohatsudake]|nr:hypothetical protein EDB85DRAFT_416268 [Lactarius pseudohatsudake]
MQNFTVTRASPFSSFGMPVDSYSADMRITASSWTLFAAAMTPDLDLPIILISRVHSRASWNTSMGVFPVYYDSLSGLTYRGEASPAQGAMYAPLALKVPVLQIAADPVTTGTSPKSKSKSHTGAIAGGAIGGVVALLAIGAAVLVGRRRSRRPKSIGSSFETDVVRPDLPMIVTPFNPTLVGATEPETGSPTNWQQRSTEPVELEVVPLAHAPNPSDSPVPSPRVVSVPAGLSSKELARLRRDNSHAQPPDPLPSGPSSPAITEQAVASSSSEARRLQSEVEALRREMQQLRVDTVERFEAPPGYDGGV